jgi:hypothetical protein
MVVNFRTREINRSTHKLVWIFTLIKKKSKKLLTFYFSLFKMIVQSKYKILFLIKIYFAKTSC